MWTIGDVIGVILTVVLFALFIWFVIVTRKDVSGGPLYPGD